MKQYHKAAKTERETLQAIIKEKYGKLIEKKKEQLCTVCQEIGKCNNLLPVTTEGADCPYFRKEGQ